MRMVIVESLRKCGLIVNAVTDAISLRARILASADEAPIDLIVSDIRLPGGSGLGVIEELRAAIGATPVILITAFSDDETRRRAVALGATLLDKPFDLRDLRALAAKLSGR
jgi:CheY-like chemotaxis protein